MMKLYLALPSICTTGCSFNPCQLVNHNDTKASLGLLESPKIKGLEVVYSVLSLFKT